MANQITQNGIDLLIGQKMRIDKPIFQLRSLINMGNQNGKPKFKVTISDGKHEAAGVISGLIDIDPYTPNCLIRLENYLNNTNNEGATVNVLIIVKMSKVADCNQVIGKPVAYRSGNNNNNNQNNNNNNNYNNQRNQNNNNNNNYNNQRNQNNNYNQNNNHQNNNYNQNNNSNNVNQNEQHLFPIRNLNPYQDKWTIKGKIVSKSDVKTWKNDRGNGKLFSFEIMDKSNDRIRCTCFNDAVDSFESMIQPKKVFYISKGAVKFANKKFNSIGDYEITLDTKSIVTPCDDEEDFGKIQYNFRKISEIPDVPANATIDILAYVISCGDLEEINTKKGTQLKKRVLTLIDDSNSTVEFTIWSHKAEQFSSSDCVIAVNAVKVSDYNGKTLSTTMSSEIEIYQGFEAGELEKWYQNNRGGEVQVLTKKGTYTGTGQGTNSNRAPEKFFKQVIDESIGRKGSPDNFSNVCTITKVFKNGSLMYPSCTQEKCLKKVQQINDKWFCETCNFSSDECNWRYILKAQATDSTGSQRLDFFGDKAEILMKLSANQLHHLQNNDITSFDKVFQEAEFEQCYLRMKAYEKDYQGTPRFQVQVVNMFPLDFVKQSKRLLDKIGKYESQNF